jgi:hypothetical protein
MQLINEKYKLINIINKKICDISKYYSKLQLIKLIELSLIYPKSFNGQSRAESLAKLI